MGRRLRFIPEGSLVEVTCRTLQGRFLLQPTGDLPRIVVGILTRARERYPLRLHAFAFLSNHFHLLVSPENAQQLAGFMRYLNTNLSKEAGRVHRWQGALFVRRYQAIPVSGEEIVQVARLRYILAQGCKEGLVSRPTEWPGAHCAKSLLEGTAVAGIWFDRTQEWLARHRGETCRPQDFATEYLLELDPLPCWQDLTPGGHREHVLELVKQVETETRRLHRDKGTQPLGVAGILSQRSHDRPNRVAKSPAPLVHAATRKVRLEFRCAYGIFVAAFRKAAQVLRSGDHGVSFPAGAFPPPRPFTLQDIRGAPSY